MCTPSAAHTLPVQVHRFLGLNVGLVQSDLKPDQRKMAYGCDITYVTNSELGFDYLRDNLAAVGVLLGAVCTQRLHHWHWSGKHRQNMCMHLWLGQEDRFT